MAGVQALDPDIGAVGTACSAENASPTDCSKRASISPSIALRSSSYLERGGGGLESKKRWPVTAVKFHALQISSYMVTVQPTKQSLAVLVAAVVPPQVLQHDPCSTHCPDTCHKHELMDE